ncbi:MAG TPA: MFS transporter [Rheinheimera sp.]|uniref:peptide MFS transporter n=1 Tax=Rheinheimera sp. TaxID=1869214 RepID=UPI000EECC6BA|nr:oligopeptide:H+ symporter [Rheinheimera sp.]HCU66737.1 MFS transporter [Rheinheimera sp.]
MSQTQTITHQPEFETLWGHPKPLWMLFMAEFWERFAFYGIRWALTLYIVAQFYAGNASGEGDASRYYGAYLALVYATAIFGGYVADRIIGYQRSILLGAVVMSIGLFMIMVPSLDVFLLGLAVIVVGNGLFKPNISSLVGQLYKQGDDRRDRGFTIFYMGINLGGMLSPLLTGWLASEIFGTPQHQNYKAVFGAAGIGMILSTIWFYIGRKQLKGIGMMPEDKPAGKMLAYVIAGVVVAVPVVYFLMAGMGAQTLAWVLGVLFVIVAGMLLLEGKQNGRIQMHRVCALLLLFGFNVTFWMFFEQAGSSFNFLAQNLVNRDIFADGSFIFPTGWFQSVNSLAIILFAPVISAIWYFTSKRKMEPTIPFKFGLGLLGNALGFLVLMFALTQLVDGNGLIPLWPLVLCYVLQSIGELCLSPIGLSMVTKLAPVRYVGLAMGAWFLSVATGNNLSGILAGEISGETGMTIESALAGFSFSFYLLLGAGILLLLISPLINKLMHGVK